MELAKELALFYQEFKRVFKNKRFLKFSFSGKTLVEQ